MNWPKEIAELGPLQGYVALQQWIYARHCETWVNRMAGKDPPYTHNEYVAKNKFTNVWYCLDRGSIHQAYIVNSPASCADWRNCWFRTMWNKSFNLPSTWNNFKRETGEEPSIHNFDVKEHTQVLSRLPRPIFGSAYIIPASPKGTVKHEWYLQRLARMIEERVPERIFEAGSFRGAYKILSEYPLLGSGRENANPGFLAFQFCLNLNWSSHLDWKDDGFCVPGPGTRRGLRKCFQWFAAKKYCEVARRILTHQEECFELVTGHPMPTLFGRRLGTEDVGNLLCDGVDKYCRVAYPELSIPSDPQRIKHAYDQTKAPPPPRLEFPRCFGIDLSLPLV
jgi:hypothetical protein